MFELHNGYEIHNAKIAPRDRVFVLPPGSACPEHDAPHFPSLRAAREAIDRLVASGTKPDRWDTDSLK